MTCIQYTNVFLVYDAMTDHSHKKRVKHFHRRGDLHELTFSCYLRMPLLTNDLWRVELSRAIDIANRESQFELVAFVYMPEHVHLLVFPLVDEPNIGQYLSMIKRPVSQYVHQSLESTKSPLWEKLKIRERPGKQTFRFWQEGPGYDRNLFSRWAIEASINYLHRNPVERGLCQEATAWKWSSARYYLGNPPQQQDPLLPMISGSRPEFFERDARDD